MTDLTIKPATLQKVTDFIYWDAATGNAWVRFAGDAPEDIEGAAPWLRARAQHGDVWADSTFSFGPPLEDHGGTRNAGMGAATLDTVRRVEALLRPYLDESVRSLGVPGDDGLNPDHDFDVEFESTEDPSVKVQWNLGLVAAQLVSQMTFTNRERIEGHPDRVLPQVAAEIMRQVKEKVSAAR